MTESAMSDAADPLYRPLGGLEPWAAAMVDEAAWADALARVQALGGDEPDVGDMVRRGTLLGFAHQSGALDGLYPAQPEMARSLLRGESSLASLDPAGRDHVRANLDALLLSRETPVSETGIRGVHEVACRPQLTHRVRVGERVQDHVLAGGDYKHHPNHGVLASGEWLPTAPVALVLLEMARLVETVGSSAFAALHPLAQAAYLHHALLHVQPFADGNGRVARALAGGLVLREAGIPPVIFAGDETVGTGPAALVDALQRAFLATVDLLEHACSSPDEAALDRWRRESETAQRLRAEIEAGLAAAIQRYGERADGSRVAGDLSGSTVVPGEPLVLRASLPGGPVVEEVVAVDAHPLDAGLVVAVAHEARLRLEAGAPVEPWLDRVVSCLGLRVAAELEE